MWLDFLQKGMQLDTVAMHLAERGADYGEFHTAYVQFARDWFEPIYSDKLRNLMEDGGQMGGAFLWSLYMRNQTHALYTIDDDRTGRLGDMEKGVCAWPECKLEGLEKDHILPDRAIGDKEWKNDAGLNGQRLCRFHNRMKTNSIGIGLAMFWLKHKSV